MSITNPRDISDLAAWYSAEAETGYADGAELSTWSDLSGNGHDATAMGDLPPLWRSSLGPSGGAAVEFIGTGNGVSDGTHGYFSLPDVMAGATQGEVFYNLRADSSTTMAQLHSFTINDYSYFTYKDGKVYEGFGTDTRKAGFTPSLTVAATWRRYSVGAAAGDYLARLDEVDQISSTSNTVGSFVTNPLIGHSRNAAGELPATGSGVQPWKGRMTTVLVFRRKLTTTERADVVAWMAANPSGGTTVGGTLAVTVPATAVDLAGTYTPPLVTGALSAALPTLTVALSGVDLSTPISGTLDVETRRPVVNLTGDYQNPDLGGVLEATLPAPTLTLAGAYYPRNGYGLVLDSETTVDAEAPLPATPSDTGVAALTLHIVTPTLPAPVLVDGRPTVAAVFPSAATFPDADLYPQEP